MIQFNILIKSIPQIKHAAAFFFNYHKSDFVSMSDYLVSVLHGITILGAPNFIWDYIESACYRLVMIMFPSIQFMLNLLQDGSCKKLGIFFKCIHTKRCLVKNSHSTSRLAFTFKGISTSTYDSSAQSSSPQNLLHFHHSNTKSLFKHLCLLSSPDKLTQGVINNSSAIHKPCEAELFSQYFNSVFSTNGFVLPPIDEISTSQSQLSNTQIDSSDVFNALHLLYPSKATGCDISPSLKFCSS